MEDSLARQLALIAKGITPKQDAPTQSKKASHSKMHKFGLPVMMGGQIADALSTISALKRPNTHEGNPIYGKKPSAGKVWGIKAATTLPTAYLLDRLASDHPKLALGLALGIGALGFGAAGWNQTRGRK